jgi:drug/metabolite transporter (DMT)-like permease
MAERVEPGAQLERTALAWNRSLLALAVNGALLIRAASVAGDWSAWVGIAVLLATGVLWVVTSRTYRRLRGQGVAQLLAGGSSAVWFTAFVAAIGVVDLVVIATYRPGF